MDSSVGEVTLKGSSSDQLAGQGLSSIKKRGKGNGISGGLAALIGGPGSFANLLIKKGDGEKEGTATQKTESAAGNNEVEKALRGSINGGQDSFLLKKTMGHAGIEAVAPGTEISSGKNADIASILRATGDISDVKTKGKWNSEIAGEHDEANPQTGSFVRQGDALRSASVSEAGKTALLKQGVLGSGKTEKQPSGDEKLPTGEAGTESARLLSDALKGNGIEGMSASDGLRSLSVKEMDDRKYRPNQDLPKGSDVKGSSISKVSPDPNEALSIKKGAQYSGDALKDKVTSMSQVQTETKIENLRNLSAAALKSERTLPNGSDDVQAVKTGPSPSTAQTDFSMVNGVWSDVRTSAGDKIAAPVVFQEIAGQIIDGASNMLMKGSSRIVITLEPPNLGTLNMDVRVQHDMVRMVLVADSNDVKQVLNANLDQLKTALQGQGLNIDRFDVLVHDRSYDANQGFQPGGGALFDGGRGGRSDTKGDGLPPQALPSGGNQTNEPSLGIISLFV